VASLERTVHGDLEWITMKALEKEPRAGTAHRRSLPRIWSGTAP